MQYSALVPERVALGRLLVFCTLAVSAESGPPDRPYLIKEPGAEVLACIARVDSIRIEPMPMGLSPSHPVSVVSCTSLRTIAGDGHESFSIRSYAAAFPMTQLPAGLIDSTEIDPYALCTVTSSDSLAVWYKLTDTILIVATENPVGRLISHEIRYVRFLRESLEDLDQKPERQLGMDPSKAVHEFRKRKGQLETSEIYILIKNSYEDDPETLREILENMLKYYAPDSQD